MSGQDQEVACQSPLKKCTSEGKMERNQPEFPEGSYRGELLTNFDIERGDKEKKEGLGAGTLEQISLKIHSWGYHVQRTLRHFPFALLSFLMLSSLYPDVTLPLCTVFIVFIIITLVDYTRTPLKTH